MTSDLAQAYHGVYNSSSEIMKNKQRHLYVNMLDLLTRTTRATGASSTNLLTEEYVKFWYTEILPLIFDEDKSIQENAIAAVETVLPYLETINFQNYPEWPGIKTTIVEVYSKNLHDLRQNTNSNWSKIWCLLVRILSKDLLKGASVINTFLSIVELGFRSSDYGIRAEAFLCWKVLVEIFAKHNEIFSPKRIKLVSIPLKSSQSKTLEASVNKFKVWWYFICKLSQKIEDYLETIYEPFLTFCFTSHKNSQTSPSQQVKSYPIVKQMAILCLIESLGISNREITSSMDSLGLEHPDNPIINKNVMIKCGESIMVACFEAMIMINENSGNRGKHFEALWKNLLAQLVEVNDLDMYQECIRQINTLNQIRMANPSKVQQHNIWYILDLLGNHKSFPCADPDNVIDINKLCQIITIFTDVLCQQNSNCPVNIIQSVINNTFNIHKYKNLLKYWDIQRNLMEYVMGNSEIKNEYKIMMWKRISLGVTDFLNENLFEFRIEKNAEVVNRWLLWPLDKYGNGIEDTFLDEWNNLASAASSAEGKLHFVQYLVRPLRNLFDDSEKKCPRFIDVLATFISILEQTFENSSKPAAAFDLINYVLSKPPKIEKTNNKILEALTTYISKLGENQIIEAFPDIKAIFSTVIQTANSAFFTKSSVEEFKRILQDKLKSNKAKEKKLLKEIKDLMKNDSYVIIPTVWSLKPDKLTEHQKEKMKEKRNDIPALYNDMSQSQDTSSTSIKPWTPKKIVIAKGKDSAEIVIENKNSCEMETEDIPLSLLQNNTFVTPLPVSNSVDKSKSQKSSPKKNSTEKQDVKKEVPKIENSDNKKVNKLKDGEKILNKLNIEVQNEQQKLLILRQLKSIEIDTVEGNTVVTGKLRNRQSTGKQPEVKRKINAPQTPSKKSKITDEDKEHDNTESKRKEIKSPRKVLTNEKSKENEKSEKEAKTNDEINSSDEIVGSSQASESVLSKKLPLRKSFSSNVRTDTIMNNKSKPEDSKKRENVKSTEDPEVYEFSEANEERINTKISTDSPFKARNIFSPRSKNKFQEKTGNSEDSSNNNKIIDLGDMDTELNTTLNVESVNLSNGIDKTSTQNRSQETQKISEQDTQPNTEFNQSRQIDFITSPPFRNIHPCRTTDNLPETPLNTLRKNDRSSLNCSKNSLNHSILSSPEDKDTDERNAELLNSTLNISPILVAAKNDNNDQKMLTDDTDKALKLLKPSPQQMSPPERKPTNNSESPAHRPKITSQLMGRGAQLINMIRNKRVECVVPKPQPALMSAKTDEKNSTEQANQGQHPQQTSPKNDQAIMPALHKDLLIFSKVLPSPDASPSASILKRKFRRSSLDDIESPMNKRKRVSFHDPPVSVRKEYVKTVEEEKYNRTNRCLLPDKTSTPQNAAHLKHALKRKSRADSIVEILKFAESPAAQSPSTININFGANPNTIFGQTSVEMDSLKWNNTTNENGQQDDNETSLIPSPSMYFSDESAVLKHVLDKYSIETILEKYLETGKTLTNKSVRAVTKEICTQMSNDAKLKTKVLEILSEKHPKEFLEHAVQENLSFAVCDRLNFNSIIEFVCEKSKNTEQLRKALLDRIQCTLNNEKLIGEVYQFIMSLLKNHHMTDQEIVSCMDVILKRHRQNKQQLLSTPPTATTTTIDTFSSSSSL